MKLLLFLSFCWAVFGHNCSAQATKFSIMISDVNYSLDYTLKYQFDNDSIRVIHVGSFQNESDRLLMSRKLKEEEMKAVLDFLKNFPFDSIKSEYKNPMILDGDIKRIVVKYNSKWKVVNIENVYQKDIADLIVLLNKLLEKGMKINYQY